MQPAIHWRHRPAMGSGREVAARQRPIFQPFDIHAEWDHVTRARSNVLLAGTSTATKATLVQLKPHLREPLRQYTPTKGVSVPQPRKGTLLLLEVARLDRNQQMQLLQWLDQFDECGQMQVVSTTSQPIFSLVESGAFLAKLYYRLNVIRIDLIPSGESIR